MALEGTIKDFSPFDIMELINIKQKTGLLFMTAESGETITLGFDKNGLVMAQSSEMSEDMMLGRILVKSGKISEQERDKALELQKGTLDRLGYILCQKKYCTEEDISRSLQVQIKRIFYNLLHWKEGIYIFEPRDSIDYFHEFVKPVYVKPMSIKGLLMEGALMIDEWPRIEKVIKSLNNCYKKLPLPEMDDDNEVDEFDFFGNEEPEGNQKKLNSTEKIIYELLDGEKTIKEIVEYTLLSEFVVCKTIYDLFHKKLVEEVGSKNNKVTDRSVDTRKNNEESINEDWEAAKQLIPEAFPEAIVIELGILNKKDKILQGKTDISLWKRPITELMENIEQFDIENKKGAFETVEGHIGMALFWSKKKDFTLFVVSYLEDESETSRFRAHIATVSRNILN